ncbi:MAG: hypothetical protein Q8909_08130 [Bacteroidota bacterium]|nr:hypothetical protein [Bacteroidota bacterium]
MINIYAAWIGFLLGCIAGAVPGLFFHKENWLGGYGSWKRRMIRLGHIAFWGIGFLNLSFGLTAKAFGLDMENSAASILLIIGAIAMPLTCYLSAWKPFFRNFFFIPALSVTFAILLFLTRIL